MLLAPRNRYDPHSGGRVMFGMLDYRAHKLYKVLVFPFNFVLSLFAILGLPIISYLIAAYFSSQRIIQLLLAVVICFLSSEFRGSLS